MAEWGVFFFRLTNWAILVVVMGLVAGPLTYLTTHKVFKRPVPLLGCMGSMVVATIFSFLFNFGLVYGLAMTQTYVATWIIGAVAIVTGILGAIVPVALLRDRLTGTRLGLLRASGTVALGVVAPLLVFGIALTVLRG